MRLKIHRQKQDSLFSSNVSGLSEQEEEVNCFFQDQLTFTW